RDDADEQELAPTDLEHGDFNSERRAMRRRPPPIHASAGLLPRRAAAQPALRVSVTVAVGAGAGWWSIVFGSVLTGSVSAFSSSVSPFLNDLMPLAKSPISSEILPRPPNSSRPTARTRIQCQMLIEPMRNSSASTRPHARLVSRL